MNARIRRGLAAVFTFNAVSTTILLVLTYAAIFSTVFITDELPPVPSNTQGLNLDQAWWDLHRVSERPHSFNSHANDLVRDFILDRLGDIASQYPHVTMDYDVVSNASWTAEFFAQPQAVYQEGNNILVKVLGTDPAYRESGGYLLSAHYDSVPTGPGTTDDSMGVVTLLQLVEYFTKNRPKRTMVFNINNNEESGLNGAHTFLQHPWARISDVFLNLESGGGGGRPVMFRATNIAPLFSWTSSHVPHPHANVIFADSFSRGIVRSATDYSVYEKAGFNGLDFAFYRGRSHYHTWQDSIPSMDGGQKALWAMMEAAQGASLALANEDIAHTKPVPQQERPVYFELFATTFVVFSLESLFITNVVLLSTGPILLILLAYLQHVIRLSRSLRLRHPGHSREDGTLENALFRERALGALKRFGAGFWISTKFWVALEVSIGLQAALITGFVNLNPFIIHSRPLLVFVSALSLAYLSIVMVVAFPCSIRGAVLAPEQQKLSILLQMYSFTWVSLVLSTIALRSLEIGGTYFITAWNMCTLLGCVVGLVEVMTGARGFETETEDWSESHNYVGGAGYQAIGQEEDVNGQQSSTRIVEDSEPTETSPLVAREHLHRPTSVPSGGEGAIGWWILQVLLVVPLPVILVLHIAIMVLGSLNQTLTDGNNPTLTYSIFSLMSLMVVLPICPFSINIHRWLALFVLVTFIVSTACSWAVFPFTHEAPLKVYFMQTVDLSTTRAGVERVTTELSGPKQFLAQYIIPELPSASGKAVRCYDALDKHRGLQTCSWEVEGEMTPSPGGKTHTLNGIDMPWVTSHLNRTGPNSAQITVQGHNTRFCTLEFTNQRISKFSVIEDGGKGLQKGYDIPEQGVGEIQLWSRDFDKEFEVMVEWKDDGSSEIDDEVQGRVSCGWNEYERATIGGGRSGGKIPSLEEVIQYLPEWAVVSKSASALFSAGSAFSG